MDSVEAIIEAIHQAFAGVPRGAITIHEAKIIDYYGGPAERAEARKLDTEPSWELVPDSDIEECETALCFLDPEGWRYYVPAFMIWSLRHFRVSPWMVSDFTIYTFGPLPRNRRQREYMTDRHRLLDDAQCRAVCWFLRYMSANANRVDGGPATAALAEYWGKYCKSEDDEACGTV